MAETLRIAQSSHSPIPFTMSYISRFLHRSHSFPTLLIQISLRLHICTTCNRYPSCLFAPFLLTLSIRLHSRHCSFPELFYLYSVLIIPLNVRGSTPIDTAAVSSIEPHICHPHLIPANQRHPNPIFFFVMHTTHMQGLPECPTALRMILISKNKKPPNGKRGHKKT